MSTRELMSFLALMVPEFIFGIVREDENVIAFGYLCPILGKVRVGSISFYDTPSDYELLALSMDCLEEFRAKDQWALRWFLRKLAIAQNNWVSALEQTTRA